MVRYLVPFPLTIPNAAAFVAAADVNRDGKPDLLLGMSGVIGGVTVMLNTTGQPTVPIALFSLTVNPTTVAGGNISELTATLVAGAAAPTGNLTIPLTNSNPSIASVPGGFDQSGVWPT